MIQLLIRERDLNTAQTEVKILEVPRPIQLDALTRPSLAHSISFEEELLLAVFGQCRIQAQACHEFPHWDLALELSRAEC